jgi:hypothetical protein
MVLAEAVSLVEGTLVPGGVELPLLRSVAHPAELHIHSFGPPLLGGVACGASGHVVVGLSDSCGLWVAHFLEHCSDQACFSITFQQLNLCDQFAASMVGNQGLLQWQKLHQAPETGDELLAKAT